MQTSHVLDPLQDFLPPGDLLKPFQVALGKGGPPATPDVASHVRQLFAI